MAQHPSVMDSLLKTKITLPPEKPKNLLVKGLIQKFNRAVSHKVTLICAPAGYGKSTGVSLFMGQKGFAAAWLTLEETENDPLRFLSYLIAAIQVQMPDFGKSFVGVLESPQPPSLEWLLTAMLNELTERQMSLMLVLDDWHLIHSAVVVQLMDTFIAHLPESVHLFILTRQYPNLNLNTLRLRQQLMELYTADFALSVSESLSFLYEIMALPKESSVAGAVEALAQKNEGWIAGLQMHALYMKNHPEAGALSQKDHQVVFTEIFDSLPESVRLFLMLAALSNRFSTGLCNALLKPFGTAIADDFIENHMKQGHFIIALEESSRWFRFHHLYGSFLEDRLTLWLSGGSQYNGRTYNLSLAELRALASGWFLNNGYEIEAFQQASQGNHIDLAASILQGGTLPLLYRGAMGMGLEWLRSLSEAIMDARPWLWLMRATAELYHGESVAAKHSVLQAEQNLSVLSPEHFPDAMRLNMQISISAIRASLAVIDHDVEMIESQSTLALSLIGPKPALASCPSLWALGYAKLLKRQLPEALETLEQARLLSTRIGHHLVEIMATIGMGSVYEEQNLLAMAELEYMTIINRLDHQAYPVSCEAYLGLARVCLARNDIEQSFDYLETAKKLSGLIDRTDRKALCYELEARLYRAKRQQLQAFSAIEEAIRLCTAEKFYHRLESFYELQCLLLIESGHLKAAQAICTDRSLVLCSVGLKAKAGFWLEAASALEMRAMSEPFVHWPKAQFHLQLHLFQYYYEASKLDKTGFDSANLIKAYEAFRRAVSMGAQGRMIRPFLEIGMTGAELLDLMAASEAAVPYPEFERLLKMAAEAEWAERDDAAVEPLTPRELEILALIAQGLSNEDIAERLFVALSTVKGTNQRIFAKLQVQRRTEAVAKAKALGLI